MEHQGPWDRTICYSCHGQQARFGVDKKDFDESSYPDLEHDVEGWVRVPLCRDCASQWDDDE